MKRLSSLLSRKKRRTKPARRRLMVERLCQRELLASDFASIAGVVFEDTDGSGAYNAAGDTELQGVIVRLTRPDSSTVQDTTGADGAYRFDNLSAGTYTLEQLVNPPSPPNAANLRPLPGSSTQTIVITAAEADTLLGGGTVGQVIDSFNGVTTSLTADVAGTDPNQASNPDGPTQGGSALGVNRDVFIDVTSIGGNATIRTNSKPITFPDGVLNFDPDSNATVDFNVTWDGDMDPLSLDPVGLQTGGRGVDLTADGTATAVQLRIGADRPDLIQSMANPNAATDRVKVSFYTDANTFSSFDLPLIDFIGGMGMSSLGEILLPFNGVNPNAIRMDGTNGPVDFTNVGAIRLEATTNSGAVDTQLAVIQSIGPRVVERHIENRIIAPGVVLEKSTNGVDADTTATQPQMPVGSTATFTYAVTNNGNVALDSVVLTDDSGTSGTTADDFTITLTNANTTGGDGNSLLNPGETWTFITTPGTGSHTVTPGQYTNVAMVTANPVHDSGVDLAGISAVTDEDPSNHFGVEASILLEKATNGVDADTTATQPRIPVGETATFTYDVTNNGNVALSSVLLTDDSGTPANDADNFIVTLTNANTTGGDGDSLLEPGETWSYVTNLGNGSRTVTAGQHTNIAVVTANPVGHTGNDLSGIADVNSNDPSNHFGVTAMIALEKATNGIDADTTVNQPQIPVGAAATFTYAVTNTGNVALDSVVVTDDGGTPATTGDDFTITLTNANTSGGDGNNLLNPGETWTFVTTSGNGSRSVTPGQYTNIAIVNANPVSDAGVDLAGVADVSDDDPSNHFGATARITVEKATNGVDADTTATQRRIAVGETATFTYAVTNTGNVALDQVVLNDDSGTSATTVDDFSVTLTNSNTTGGDGNGLLNPGETWTFVTTPGNGSRTVTSGQYTNIAFVTANPVSNAGADLADLANVSDDDPSNHFGFIATIGVEKATNGSDADTGTGPEIIVGETATFTYTVTSGSSNVALTNVVLIDDNGTPSDASDDFMPVRNPGGDTDNDDELDPGEVWTYTATRIVTLGQYTNLATVIATDPNGAQLQPDSDASNHVGVNAPIPIVPLAELDHLVLFSKRLFIR